ncbi:MAG: potassium channel family protein [Candidatus Nanopelagicales bacterium]
MRQLSDQRRKDPARLIRGELETAPIKFRALFYLLLVFFSVITVFSFVFHAIMESEGKSYSLVSSFYWAVVTMSTLGYGDIVFTSDTGKIFSIVVIISGIAFLLVLLPYVLIQYIVIPIVERRRISRAPRFISDKIKNHLVLINTGSIEDALIRRVEETGLDYVLIVGDLDEALRLHDAGYKVIVGELDNPKTYLAARIPQASLFAATRNDIANANVIFTVREVSESVPIVSLASHSASVDILEFAGADQVIELGVMLGKMMAQRIVGIDAKCQIMGEFKNLAIAEVGIGNTSLVNKTIRETQIRTLTGVNVIGIFNRGTFVNAADNSRLDANSILILAGTREQLTKYDEVFAEKNPKKSFVLIIGGGRVGREVGKSLAEMGIDYRIVEQQSDRVRDPDKYVQGNAAELKVLESAGIKEAHSIVVTTHDDDVNVYLTIYARKLRPDAQIISRARLDRNVSTLYKAGADAVLSYAATGATAIWNRSHANDTVLLADGLTVIRIKIPPALLGKTLGFANLHNEIGVNPVAIIKDGVMIPAPDLKTVLEKPDRLIIIGTDIALHKFREIYPE